MASAPIVFVPGFWLGAAAGRGRRRLPGDGHGVTPLTLPGLESVDADRSAITVADHVDAICEAVAAGRRSCSPSTVAPDSPATRRATASRTHRGDGLRRLRPGVGALDADFGGVEMPLPSAEELAADENLDGLSEEQLATFDDGRFREPGGVLREAVS